MEKTIIRRPLPPELHYELHKCLSIPDSIDIIVNVPSEAIILCNAPRIRRVMAQIRTSIHEFSQKLLQDEVKKFQEDEDADRARPGPICGTAWMGRARRKMRIQQGIQQGAIEVYQDIRIEHEFQWKSGFDALLRFARAPGMSPTESFTQYKEIAVPDNFVQQLIMHLARSRSTKSILQNAEIKLQDFELPSVFIELAKQNGQYQYGSKTVFESIDLDIGGGRIINVQDGQMDTKHNILITLHVANKMAKENWQIAIYSDESRKFIKNLQLKYLKPYEQLVNGYVKRRWGLCEHPRFKQMGNALESVYPYDLDLRMDAFLRRGAGFTNFRHFKAQLNMDCQSKKKHYLDYLFNYLAKTNYPEHVLKSIKLKFVQNDTTKILPQVWNACQKGIPEGGVLIKLEGNELRILSANIQWTKQYKRKDPAVKGMEFSIANGKGKYVFDVIAHDYKNEPKIFHGIRITIERRKLGNAADDVDEQSSMKDEDKLKKENQSTLSGNAENEEYKKKLRKRANDGGQYSGGAAFGPDEEMLKKREKKTT